MSMGLEAATISFFPKISRWLENFSSPELGVKWGVGNWFLGSSLLPTPYSFQHSQLKQIRPITVFKLQFRRRQDDLHSVLVLCLDARSIIPVRFAGDKLLSCHASQPIIADLAPLGEIVGVE